MQGQGGLGGERTVRKRGSRLPVASKQSFIVPFLFTRQLAQDLYRHCPSEPPLLPPAWSGVLAGVPAARTPAAGGGEQIRAAYVSVTGWPPKTSVLGPAIKRWSNTLASSFTHTGLKLCANTR